MAHDPKPKHVPPSPPSNQVQQWLNTANDEAQHLAESLKQAFQRAQEHRDPWTASLEQLELQLAAFRNELEFVIRCRAAESEEARHG
jgi:hypothetical protein